MTLRCHHCGRATPLATRCPNCGSPRIRYLGGGTERLEREVRERFPDLRVGRLDRDIVERRGAAERVIDDFSDGRLDVLVGTSLVTKGLDIPVGHAGRRRLVRRRAQPARRARRRADVPVPQPGGRTGRPRGPAGRGVPPDLPARPPRDRGCRDRRRGGVPGCRAGPPAPIRVAAVRAAGEADPRTDRPAAAEREAAAMAERLRTLARSGGATRPWPVPRPPTSPAAADRWRYNVVLRGSDPVGAAGRRRGGAPGRSTWTPKSLL